MQDEISVTDLDQVLKQNPSTVLIDVREEDEFRDVNLSPTKLIPLGEFEDRYKEVPKEAPVYIYCRSGRRSRIALEFLKTKGYDNCFNVTGGILAWQNEVDPEGRKA
ncbi:MAG TPA: rhodanese-like domain-containing protein [Fibrobacteria bacterium]|nr:rhodanese-like domain-containing protein [Fibrobacteria bacterium]